MNLKKIQGLIILVMAIVGFSSGKLELGMMSLILYQLMMIDEKLGDKNGTIN